MKHTPDHRFVAAAAPAIQIERTLAGFPDWPRSGARGAARRFAHQCADILEVWCATIGQARNLEPVFVGIRTPSGQPALYIPLGFQREHGMRVLRFLDGGVSDYNAPVVFPGASELGGAKQLWADIQERLPSFDLAVLEKMPEKVEDLANPLFPLASEDRHESCHVVRLFGPWEKFARERISNLADSRRRRRKLEKFGQVTTQIAENAEQRKRFFEAMMRMKRKKFIDTQGFDAFGNPGVEDFYRHTTRLLGETGPVQLSALTLDDKVLAAHWGYVDGDRFYHLMPGYEAGEWRAYAPGRLLNEWLMQWCIDREMKFLDFGIGDEPYKFDYCDLHIPLRNAYLPVTPKGRIYATVLRLEQAAKGSMRNTRLGEALLASRKRWRSWGSRNTAPSRTA